MRLTVLDASAVGGGPVSRALECAASCAGGPAARVRLYTLFSSCCASCSACAATGRCSRRHPAIEAAMGVLADADALIVGVTSSASQRDPRTEALLQRLVGAFAHGTDPRRGDHPGAWGRQTIRKRAALVSSAPPLLGVLAALGALPYGLAGAWRVLDRAGVTVVGSATVARRWAGPASWDVTRVRAERLGRALVTTRSAGSEPRVPRPAVPRSTPTPDAAPALRVRVA